MLIEVTKDNIRNIFENTTSKIAIAYSGGKDSGVLLDIAKPFKDRFTVVWINSGFAFPHVEQYIKNVVKDYIFIEIKHDLMDSWNKHGMPANTIPIDNYSGINRTITLPQLQPWQECCARRNSSLHPYLVKNGFDILLSGQRYADGYRAPSYQYYQGIHTITPLWDWQTDDVKEYLEANHIELPDHANYKNSSMECWNCPAALNPAHANFLQTRYPEYWPVVRNMAQLTVSSVLDSLKETQAALQGDEQ